MSNKIIAKYNKAAKKAREKSKPKHCILCQGKECLSNGKFEPIASHTVPHFVLKNMSTHPFFKSSWNFELPEFEKHIAGINEAGIFRMLCNKCDTELFKDYEAREENLKDDSLISKVVEQTTIKSMFKKYYDLRVTLNFICEFCDEDEFEHQKILSYYHSLLRSMIKEIDRLWDSIHRNQNEMEVIYRTILPYPVKIAAQGALLYNIGFEKDKCIVVEENTTLPWLYLTVLPLKTETFILLAKHKDDCDYDAWIQKFNGLDDNKKLDIINDMIFCELDDYFVSQDIDSDDLKQLCFKENDTFDSVKMRKLTIKNYLLPPQKKYNCR